MSCMCKPSADLQTQEAMPLHSQRKLTIFQVADSTLLTIVYVYKLYLLT